MESLGVELCDKHHDRMKALIKKYDTPLEAIQLYYGLKEAGVKAMLEWWDGKKSVDIAISRVKLNIEIDSAYERLTEEQAIHNLEEAMHSFKNGFTTIRIPHIVVRYYLNETVRNIIGIMEGLKANLKTIN
jgi:very-short-patch-repair endonuclease